MRRLRWIAPLVLVIGAIAAFVFFIAGIFLTLGDNDRYGKLRGVPGEGVVELPQGKVLVYYEERAGLPSDSSLNAPGDLRIRVRSLASREPVAVESVGSRSVYQYNDLDGVSVAELDLPAEGRYSVVARGAQGRPFPDRALTFGASLDIGALFLRSGAIFGIALLVSLVLLGLGLGARRPPRPAPAAPVGTAGGSYPPYAGPPPAPEARRDPQEELRRLEGLRASGALTPEEYERLRADLLEDL